MRALNARGLSQKVDVVGPDSVFKMKLLSRVATYPSGALRRAGASGGRAIVIAVRDAPPRSPRQFYAEDRDAPLGSRALDGGRVSYEGF
jgi:hypothetical protein